MAVTGVRPSGKLDRVPNQPKTPTRGFRIPDELYNAARECAAQDGQSLSEVVRAGLERYVRRAQKRQAETSED